ncbi:ABC transporter permease [Geoalkalibacter subterraneus]|uniref:ABC transporter permease n=1 Tax=Geoalkalibacter subterraneus TaxID=483547 RepID=A0A0B5FES3_9BACT|nr:ABC transporter permease [Geoalkalibacter subterraneus]AJF06627.1 ABC transporter permease [Geoalkalibacter subterraneus]
MRRDSVATLATYLLAALALIGVSYALPRLLPGDFVSATWGQSEAILTASQEAALRTHYLQDQSFGNYLLNLLRGQWGYSFALEQPVLSLISEALPWTLLLMGGAHLMASLCGFLIGVELAWRRGAKRERFGIGVMSALDAIPELVSGTLLLLVFALHLKWLPPGGAITPYADLGPISLLFDLGRHLLLPLSCLFLAYLPGNVLLARGSMVMVLRAPYVTTARAKGLPPWRVRYAHGARNALLPMVTRFGLRFSFMVTGALVVENLFSYPGLGTLLHQAIAQRDLPLVQGIVLLSSLLLLSVNLGLDLLYRRIDPRVCHGR